MKEALQYQIKETSEQRLDEFLASQLGWLSRMRIANLLARGACTVNQRAAHAGYHLRSGDVVEITLEEDAPTAMSPEPVALEIVYEDDCLLVVVKPAGILVHPTRGVKKGTLANALAYHLNRFRLADCGMQIDEGDENSDEKNLKFLISGLKPGIMNRQSAIGNPQLIRPGIVHRLDRATSGLMVVAKQQRALSILSRHFHHRLVLKRYLALVHGSVRADECLISAPIGRDPEALPQWGVMEDGKPAETRLRVLERRDHTTLVELEPITGRTNQLRIHCAHLGHPVVGDNWYGTDNGQRLCLHAARLAFHHPEGGAWMEFESPLPVEFTKVLKD